jgi:hypothetical protein
MKARWKVCLLLAAATVALIVIWAVHLQRPDQRAQAAVEQTRQMLRAQGFKLDMDEFDFATSEEARRNAGFLVGAAQQLAPLSMHIPLFLPAGSNAAGVVWKEETLPAERHPDLGPLQHYDEQWADEARRYARRLEEYPNRWMILSQAFEEQAPLLDQTVEVILSGPIAFEPVIRGDVLLPHLVALEHLVRIFASRALLDLREDRPAAAWTNLLATTRLATQWRPESAEGSQFVRFESMERVEHATWQLLQAEGFTDEQLLILQREWTGTSLFDGLAETAALARARMTQFCRSGRDPVPGTMNPPTLQGYSYALVRWPVQFFRGVRAEANYRRRGVYDDEVALMHYYVEREKNLRRAIAAASWKEMRLLPDAQEVPFFETPGPSIMQAVMSLHYMRASSRHGTGTLMARAADAEARRRLLITVLALERFRLQEGIYPESLSQLTPRFLDELPIDFMDGQPLRYRRTEGGSFLLYSVGLDCEDNGGRIPDPGPDWGLQRFPGQQPGSDLVWPLPATAQSP